MKLWIVGTRFNDGEDWKTDGVFTTEDLAVANVTDKDQFVVPLTPDLDITGKPGPSQIEPGWPGAYYPLREKGN